jgi:hypothetical protein
MMAMTAGAASASPAGVSATPVITSNGEAGYYAGENQPGHFKQITTQFYLRVAAKSLTTGAGEGVQLCNDSSGHAVQLGVRWNGTGFQVLFGSGTLGASAPGTNVTACNSGGAVLGAPLSPNLVIPQGDTVRLILKEISSGVYEAFAKDVTANFSASKGFTGSLTFPDEASAGVVQDISLRAAPASIKLVHFATLTARDSLGVTSTLGGTSEWTAVQAYSNHSGDNSNPAIVTPASSLSGDHFNVFTSAQVGP